MPLPVIAAAWALGALAGGGAAAGGKGAHDIRKAKQSVRASDRELELLNALTDERLAACEQAFAALGSTKLHTMSASLLPFHEVFSQLKHVDLHTDVQAEGAVALDEIKVLEAGLLTISVIGAIGGLASAGAVSAMAGAATSAGVGAFAAASTGTAISSLSGVAATNVTLAWFGGGSLASGGGGVALGTTMATGIAATPALFVGGVFLHQAGRRAAANASKHEADVKVAVAKHRESQALLDATAQQAERVEALLKALTPRLGRGTGGWEISCDARLIGAPCVRPSTIVFARRRRSRWPRATSSTHPSSTRRVRSPKRFAQPVPRANPPPDDR